MKKFTFGVKLFIFVSAIFCTVWFVIMPQYSTNYTAALIDKWNRLKNIEEPKIILVGDSNVAFGFDSKKIQEAFNMPVVNFGLTASLGQAFHTDMIMPYISEGDIVVIASHRYDSARAEIDDCVMAWSAVENNFDMWKGISWGKYSKMILAYPTYLKKVINLWTTGKGNNPVENSLYKRTAFNEYGDIEYPRPNCVMIEGKIEGYFSSRNLSEEMRIYWNKYNEYVSNKNAQLFMSSPPILYEKLPADLDLDFLQNQLENELNFPVISKFKNYIYPLEYFYDTVLHLNDVGVAIRTEQLISDLKIKLLH